MDSCGRCPADVSPINSLLLHLSCFSIEYKLRTTPESSTTCYKYRSRAPAAFHTPKVTDRTEYAQQSDTRISPSPSPIFPQFTSMQCRDPPARTMLHDKKPSRGQGNANAEANQPHGRSGQTGSSSRLFTPGRQAHRIT
ncbi:hypothetical protein T4D_7336 [Trichinella pseudospiralis]|uniref:Uncharacterized protein n=1 Tax=Trichinella pseudospiralis TaxID=6337 RepID=A0A0V1FIF3_TRIPS|nr:hypothetical protein T4D_7336 [Trichinella pseudospiralis]